MPLTYGFRAYPPRAQVFRNPWTGAAIATPVLDLSSNLGPQGYADRSGTGANGVPVGAPSNARGVFEDAIKFGGVNDYLNCGSNAPLNNVTRTTACAWLRVPAISADQGILQKMLIAGPFSGWLLGIAAASRRLRLSVDGALNFMSTNALPVGSWCHVAFSCEAVYRRGYLDGLQDIVYAGAPPTANNGTMYAGVAYGGFGGFGFYSGLIELPQVWNGALSPEQVYRNYLAAKDVPIYLNDFSSYAVTPVAKAVGSMCGPVRVTTQTMVILTDAAGKKWLAGGTSTFCYGAGDWTEDCAYGTWEFDFLKGTDANDSPYFGLICNAPVGYLTAGLNGYMFACGVNESVVLYRITNGAVATVPIVSVAATIVVGTAYSCRIVRRVGGQFALYLKGGAYPDWTLVDCAGTGSTNPVTDNTHTSGKFFNTVVRDVDRLSNLRFSRVCERPASFPWEFSATGTWSGLVSAGQVWMRCLTSGNVYLPKDLDWQTCDLKLYKGADANVTDVLLVATELGGTTAASQNGYCLRLSSDERVQLIRMDNGVVTVLAQTAAAYVALTTEYSFHITRVGSTGAFTVSILGGAYATWTEAVTATDNTYILGNYFNVDIDADDRITSPVFAAGLKAAA